MKIDLTKGVMYGFGNAHEGEARTPAPFAASRWRLSTQRGRCTMEALDCSSPEGAGSRSSTSSCANCRRSWRCCTGSDRAFGTERPRKSIIRARWSRLRVGERTCSSGGVGCWTVYLASESLSGTLIQHALSGSLSRSRLPISSTTPLRLLNPDA